MRGPAGLHPGAVHPDRGGVSEADYVDMLLQQHVSGVIFAGGLYARPPRRTGTTAG